MLSHSTTGLRIALLPLSVMAFTACAENPSDPDQGTLFGDSDGMDEDDMTDDVMDPDVPEPSNDTVDEFGCRQVIDDDDTFTRPVFSIETEMTTANDVPALVSRLTVDTECSKAVIDISAVAFSVSTAEANADMLDSPGNAGTTSRLRVFDSLYGNGPFDGKRPTMETENGTVTATYAWSIEDGPNVGQLDTTLVVVHRPVRLVFTLTFPDLGLETVETFVFAPVSVDWWDRGANAGGIAQMPDDLTFAFSLPSE